MMRHTELTALKTMAVGSFGVNCGEENLTHRGPLYPGGSFLGGGSGGGSKLFCVLWPLCFDLALGSKKFFYATPNQWQGSGVRTPSSPPPPPQKKWALASKDLPILRLPCFG